MMVASLLPFLCYWKCGGEEGSTSRWNGGEDARTRYRKQDLMSNPVATPADLAVLCQLKDSAHVRQPLHDGGPWQDVISHRQGRTDLQNLTGRPLQRPILCWACFFLIY